jgi:ABC-2 type transport system ATP-binding protein
MGFIVFRNIFKSFGSKNVLKNLNLSVHKGEVYGLIGPSGCGKSTLMKLLLGIYAPDKGDIIIDGKSLSKNLLEIRKYVGYVTQENSFYYKLTVLENMIYYNNLYGTRTGNARLLRILKDVNLDKSIDVVSERISGGMKRRLDFAISLIHDPEILVLDEPTTGLDPLLVKQFWEIVKMQKKTLIVSSHIFSEIEDNCTKFGIMNKGLIIKEMEINESTNLNKLFIETIK